MLIIEGFYRCAFSRFFPGRWPADPIGCNAKQSQRCFWMEIWPSI